MLFYMLPCFLKFIETKKNLLQPIIWTGFMERLQVMYNLRFGDITFRGVSYPSKSIQSNSLIFCYRSISMNSTTDGIVSVVVINRCSCMTNYPYNLSVKIRFVLGLGVLLLNSRLHHLCFLLSHSKLTAKLRTVDRFITPRCHFLKTEGNSFLLLLHHCLPGVD